MDLTALKNEVNGDPTLLGLFSNSPGTVVQIMNAQTQSMVKTRYVNVRTIMAECADSKNILNAIKSACQSDIEIECAWNFLNTESGIDIGNVKTRLMCDQLVTGGILTQTQSDRVKLMAVQPASRAEILGLGTITEADLRAAMEAT